MRDSTKFLMTVSVLALTVIVYYLFDPMESRFMPQCVFHKLTGWKCPACGIQRSAHALLNGNISAAAFQNIFLIFSLPYFALVCYGSARTLPGSNKISKAFCNRTAVIIYTTSFFIWWILRNVFGL